MGKKILIMGCTGMLGHTVFLQLSRYGEYEVYATARTSEGLSRWFDTESLDRIIAGVDAGNLETIAEAVKTVRPDAVINCIGLIKQLPEADNHITAISVNSLFPHQLAAICRSWKVRMIHISTDCVFDGSKGNYKEEDFSDAKDLYGRSKFLGEVSGKGCLTLRTSLIGHELKNKIGLIEWFMVQQGKIKGYTDAVFSGFPTVEMAHILGRYILPNDDMEGVYHVSSSPVSKYDLLKHVAETYGKKIVIEPYNEVRIDRSLDSERFRKITGYEPPSWEELVDNMHKHYVSSPCYA